MTTTTPAVATEPSIGGDRRAGTETTAETTAEGTEPAATEPAGHRAGGDHRGRRQRAGGRGVRIAARGRRRQGRHPALAERHDVDQRGRRARRRAAGDQGDQRGRRRARPADRGGRRGRRVRLADVRREGREAADDRRGRRRVRRLDVGQPQGDAAGVRGPRRAPLLPGAVRGPGGVAEHLLHRRHDEPADHPGPRLHQGAGDDEGVPRRLRLRVPPHGEQDHQRLRRGERPGDRRRGLPAARRHRTWRRSCRRSSTPSPTSSSTR